MLVSQVGTVISHSSFNFCANSTLASTPVSLVRVGREAITLRLLALVRKKSFATSVLNRTSAEVMLHYSLAGVRV